MGGGCFLTGKNDITKYDYVPALGHNMVKIGETDEVKNTHLLVNYGIYKCSRCGEEEKKELSVLGSAISSEVIPPTCTKQGYTETHESNFITGKDDITKSDYIPATGHKWSSWKVTVKATVLQKGTKTRACSVCGKKQTAEISKLKATVKLNTGAFGLQKGIPKK